KVLSNTPYVSEQTKQRVLEAVRELGYSPSLVARSLTGNRTYVIGLYIPYEPNYLFNDPFLLQVIRGVEEIANERDYNLLFATARHSNPQSAYTRLLRTGYVDGLIILETVASEELEHKLTQSTLPRVAIGYPRPTKNETGQATGAIHSNDYAGAF